MPLIGRLLNEHGEGRDMAVEELEDDMDAAYPTGN